ncbi:hypothetical protein [Kocuria rhizophila]|uniref:hypothetical protein n=1 Tax=Kocuria rhizophila TaxID=72000 RepID=UPI000F51D67C|nr:hypothetical protein [Kocuria rhizophila]
MTREMISRGDSSSRAQITLLEARINEMWQNESLKVATAIENTLISYNGLNVTQWRVLNKPEKPELAARLINREAFRTFDAQRAPNKAICPPNRDWRWLLEWAEIGLSPFNQVYGNSFLFDWESNAWNSNVDPELVKVTTADDSVHRCSTLLSNGATIRSIEWRDPVLDGDLWPLLEFGNERDGFLWHENPDPWRGPGVVFSVSNKRTRKKFTTLREYRARRSLWDGRWETPGNCHFISTNAINAGSSTLLSDFRSTPSMEGFSFELDICWNEPQDLQARNEILDSFLPPDLSRFVQSMEEIRPEAINENRGAPFLQSNNLYQASVLDLALTSIPSTRRRTRQLVVCTRWVRLILVRNGLIALWHPIDQADPSSGELPWPHSGIPARTQKSLSRMRNELLDPTDRQLLWFQDTFRHQLHHNSTWDGEIEHWQDDVFHSLGGELNSGNISTLRGDLSRLSSFISSARWSHQALQRRARELEAAGGYPKVANLLCTLSNEIATTLKNKRSELSDGFTLLSTVSQRIQEEETIESRQSVDRLNWLVTLFTAVLLVPTVVSGVYGANLGVLSTGATGSLTEMLTLMVGLALMSYGGFNLVPVRRKGGVLGIVFGGALIAYYEISLRLLQIPPNLLILAGIPLIFLVYISVTAWRGSRGRPANP